MWIKLAGFALTVLATVLATFLYSFFSGECPGVYYPPIMVVVMVIAAFLGLAAGFILALSS